MKNTLVLLVSALMMLSLISCKKIIGEKANKSASGLYCYKNDKCQCTIKGEALAFRCKGLKPDKIWWNDKVKGYTGGSSGQNLKVQYIDKKFLVYGGCNESFIECGDTATYTRCK